MALVYLNGFDELSDPDQFWLNDSRNVFHPANPGRFGRGQALVNHVSGGGEFLRFPFTNYGLLGGFMDTAIVGCAIKFTFGNWTTSYGTVLFRWYHWVGDCRDVAAGYYETCRLGLDANHILYVARCDNVVARGTHPLLPGRYYYVEWKATTKWEWHSIDPCGVTAGLLPTDEGTNEVRVDGATEIAGPSCAVGVGGVGSDTEYINILGVPVLTAPCLQVLKFNYDNFRVACTIDDLYVANRTGTANNDFLGDVAVQNIQVAANSTVDASHDQWTLGAGASKPTVVRELEPDCDISYVSAKQTGLVQTFKFGAMRPGALYIPGVSLRAVMRKNDIGQRRVSFWANGWTTNQSINPVQPPDGYGVFAQGLDTNPATGQPWTEADVNSLEAGVQLVQ
jgi:hypothetical protein